MNTRTRCLPTIRCLLAAALLGVATAGAQEAARNAAGAPNSDEILNLSPFSVTTTRDRGYGTTNSLGASRVNVPIEDIPATVIALNSELMRDTGSREIIDVLRFVSGVSVASTPLNGQFTLRGQNLTGSTMRDGLPEFMSVRGAQFLDLVAVDRIEVIKGPAGALYGSHNVGGIVNRVTKQPLGSRQASVTASNTISNGHSIYRIEADATGPIDEAGKLRYRVVGAYSDGDTWYNRNYHREAISPMISFSPSSETRLWGRYEYQFADIANTSSAWFANAKGQISTFIPRDRVADDPWESFRFWQHFVEGGIEQSFFDRHWTSRLVVRLGQADANVKYYTKPANGILMYDRNGNLLGNYLAAGIDFSDPSVFGSIIQRRQYTAHHEHPRDRNFYWDNVINFTTGPVTHQLLAYAGYSKSRTTAPDRRLSAVASTPEFDFLNPVYERVFNSGNIPLLLNASTAGTGELRNFGVQDALGLFDGRLVLVGGVRKDKVENNNRNLINNTATNTSGKGTSIKLGVVGKVMDGVSLFYNYAETFNPQYGTYFRYPDLVELPRQNQIGKMDEFGVKFDLLESRLVATASYFEITQDNALGAGPVVNSTSTSVPLDLQRTRGWELDLAYQPTPALTFMGGIGDLTSRTANGIRARGVGQGINYKFFGKYTLLNGQAKGLSFGLGYEFTNDRAGDAADSFNLPNYGVWNAMLAYERGRWSVRVNVNNLTDEVYAASSAQSYLIWAGDPRSTMFSVRYGF